MKVLKTICVICLLLCGCAADDGTKELWDLYDRRKQDADVLDKFAGSEQEAGRTLKLRTLRRIDKINPAAKHPTNGKSVSTLIDELE
jgi:hypothetical protein